VHLHDIFWLYSRLKGLPYIDGIIVSYIQISNEFLRMSIYYNIAQMLRPTDMYSETDRSLEC